MLNKWNQGALGVMQVAGNEIKVAAVASASAGEVDVIVLPKGCIINKTVVEVVEGFDCGTPALSVGYNASADNLVPSASVTASTAGFYQNGTTVMYHTPAATTVKAKLGRTGAAGAAGKANVYVEFYRANA